jgi:hypothetical protein
VQGILDNDFYIGTLRQGKYTRKKINGKEQKRDECEHLVFENHHQAIIDYRTFATTKALREKRTRVQLPGREDQRQHLFRLSRLRRLRQPHVRHEPADMKDAYRCGNYHRRGLKAAPATTSAWTSWTSW